MKKDKNCSQMRFVFDENRCEKENKTMLVGILKDKRNKWQEKQG